jgi:CheY-like chemotaxis protein
MRLELTKCDLQGVIRAGIEALRPAAEARGIEVRTSLDGVPPIRADGRRVQQIVWNLISNAVKFSHRGGVVEVELRDLGSGVEISVADSGVGIEPDFLPYVFERFRQADSSSTRQYGGLGLGLAIVRHLAELHGGSVTAVSPGVGFGARFTVTLPRGGSATSAEKTAEQTTDQVATNGRPLDGLRLLVVDDEPDARSLLSTSLRKSGAEVLAVASAAEALAEVERRCPDVLIADVAMPETDGFALIREIRLRESGSCARLPAVAVTALTGEDTGRRIVEAGFDLHALKPFEPRALVAMIEQLRRPG